MSYELLETTYENTMRKYSIVSINLAFKKEKKYDEFIYYKLGN